ncbi:unnamed protein product, partial [Prorocentrum cordatum]
GPHRRDVRRAFPLLLRRPRRPRPAAGVPSCVGPWPQAQGSRRARIPPEAESPGEIGPPEVGTNELFPHPLRAPQRRWSPPPPLPSGPPRARRQQPPAAMARSVLRGLASCCALAVGGTALALDEQSLIQTVARQELAMPENKLPRSALLTVCFVSKASPGRHSVDQLTNGCILNVASFKLAAPQSDVILIAPTEENAADKIKNLSKKDSSVKISYVGLGPWEVGGQSIPFQNAEGKFYGNGLKLLWYTQTLKKFQGQYDYIFIADGADLYFQRSPVAGKTG